MVSAVAGGRVAASVVLRIVVGIDVYLLVALRGRLRLVAVALIDDLDDAAVVVRIVVVLRLLRKLGDAAPAAVQERAEEATGGDAAVSRRAAG